MRSQKAAWIFISLIALASAQIPTISIPTIGDVLTGFFTSNPLLGAAFVAPFILPGLRQNPSGIALPPPPPPPGLLFGGGPPGPPPFIGGPAPAVPFIGPFPPPFIGPPFG